MDKHAGRNFYRYEKKLSPFGRIVLDALIKQREKVAVRHDKSLTSYRPFHHNEQRRVITFNDQHLPVVSTQFCPGPPLKLIPCKDTNLDDIESPSFLNSNTPRIESPLNLPSINDPLPVVPSSVDIIQTVPSNRNDTNEFLHPIVAANKNLLRDIYKKDDESLLPEVTHSNEETVKNVGKEITWDDILDSKLFPDTNKGDLAKDKGNENGNTFEIRSPGDDKVQNVESVSKNGKINKKRKSKPNTNTKTKKARNEIAVDSNVINTIDSIKPKTNVKAENLKTAFRKQKYTKTVKNWLDNVEPYGAIDDQHCGIISNIDSNTKDTHKAGENITNGQITTTEIDLGIIKNNVVIDKRVKACKNNILGSEINNITIEKTVKRPKKVVQAQLANKDGVMKFGKPKTPDVSVKTAVNEDSKPNNKDKKLNTKAAIPGEENKQNSNKEKKVKKFLPPIKSQIPIKEVTYEICVLDKNNIGNYANQSSGVKDSEIIAVLKYRNGYCQLNSHHTDGTCAPDGLIISYYDMFYCFQSPHQEVEIELKQILENNKVICYEARDILIYLADILQMQINSIDVYDAQIGASLLDPDNPPENFSELQKVLSFTPPYTIATECTLQKSAWYMTLLKECWTKLYSMLVEDSLWKVFVEIEMKLPSIIADMERHGVLVDQEKLKTMEEILLTRMKLVEQQCYKAAGKVFQINSTVQVRAILYDELQLDRKCNVKIKETICKGAKSTSETMLRSLMADHPLPKLILEYRHLHKAHATFLTGIAQHVKNGIVKPTWVQTAAATGRIASNNPNLQAIPKAPFNLVMFPDPEDKDNIQLIFRSVYVPREGCSFLAADFKHVECRVFAHAAADTGLLNTLASAEDFFRVLAAKWLKKPESEVVGEERERTKRLVYASLYGAGTRKLMEILGVTYEDALQISATFNRTFPSLKSFGRGVVSRCSQQGGRLTTLCGRVRKFANISSEDFALKSHAERQAVNFIIQGSAADLCKIAMIETDSWLHNTSPPVLARLVLQIHDELVWELPDHQVDVAAEIIKEVMEGCGQRCGMTVPLPVAISVGKSWGCMEDYIP